MGNSSIYNELSIGKVVHTYEERIAKYDILRIKKVKEMKKLIRKSVAVLDLPDGEFTEQEGATYKAITQDGKNIYALDDDIIYNS